MRKMYSKKQIEGMAKAVADSEIANETMNVVNYNIEAEEYDNLHTFADLVEYVGDNLTDNNAQTGQVLMADGEGGVAFGNGGTKLYKHEIEIDDDGTLHYMNFVSTISSQLTMTTFVSNMKLGLIQVGYFYGHFVADSTTAEGQPIITILPQDSLEVMLTDGSGGGLIQVIDGQAGFTDTITPL